MKPLILIALAGTLLLPAKTNGQCGNSPQPNVWNGVWIPTNVATKKVIQYTYLREADVMWSKRIWRTIDLKERMNHPLYYPEEPLSDRSSLFDVIKNAALCEGMTVYDPIFGDDQFRYPKTTYSEKYQMFCSTDSVMKTDPYGNPLYDANGNIIYIIDSVCIASYDIIEYHIKEDWFFDDELSVMDVRIIGIAPVVWSKDENGDIRGKKELFWVYFPELRYHIQNEKVFNVQNDAQEMSFDDLFWKRMFSSFIYKESNVYGRKISQYSTGVDALLEADRIKQELFTVEHDVWHF